MYCCTYALASVLRFFLPSIGTATRQLMAVGLLSSSLVCTLWIGIRPAVAVQVLEHLAPHPRLAVVAGLIGLVGFTLLLSRLCFHYRAGKLQHLARPAALSWPMCPIFILGMQLPWAIDEKLYHLTLPLYALHKGRWVAPLGHINAGFFSLGDWWAAWGLVLGSVPAARMAQGLGWVLGCQAIAEALPKVSTRRFVIAQIIFLMVPSVVWQLGCAYVDVLQAALEVAAVVWLACASRATAQLVDMDRFGARQKWFAGAWLFGCAVATKTTMLALLPGLLLILLLCRQHEEQHILRRRYVLTFGQLGILMSAAMVPSCVYLLHNILTFGSLLYPFGIEGSSDGVPLWPSQVQTMHQFMAQHGPYIAGQPVHGIKALLLVPLHLLFYGEFSSPSFDGVLGPIWIWAIVVVVWRAGLRQNKFSCQSQWLPFGFHASLAVGLGLWCTLRLTVWFSTSWQARFLIGPVWASALVLAWLWPSLGRCEHKMRWCFISFVACLSCCAYLPSLSGAMPMPRLAAIFDDIASRHARRLKQEPQSQLCDELNKKNKAQAMLVWTQKLGLYCSHVARSDSLDEGATMQALLNIYGRNGVYVAQNLTDNGINHILVDESLLTFFSQEVKDFSIEKHHNFIRQWNVFRKQFMQEERRSGSVVVYSLNNNIRSDR